MTGTGARREPRSGGRSPTHPPLLSLLYKRPAASVPDGRTSRRSPSSLPSAQPGTGGLGHLTPPSPTVGCVGCAVRMHTGGVPGRTAGLSHPACPSPSCAGPSRLRCGRLRLRAPPPGGAGARGHLALLRPFPGCSPGALASGPAAPTLRGCPEPLSPGLGQVGPSLGKERGHRRGRPPGRVLRPGEGLCLEPTPLPR